MTTVINSAIWLKRLGLIAFSIITLSIAMKVIEEWQYSEIFELTASSSNPQQLCGIRPGKRMFEIPHTVYVLLGGVSNYDLTSFIRVNKELPKQSFVVDGKGCVQISFALQNGPHQFAPQNIQIKFN